MKSVFISSTSKDLQAHREAVKKAIERLELRAIDMTNFGSRDGDAPQVSLEEVRKADIFIGILANRYGYVPDGMDKSVTEQEYDEATRLKIPRLMYLVDEDYFTTLPDTDPMKAHGSDASPKMEDFKNRINTGQVRSLFTTPDNLANQVSADLGRQLAALQQRGRIGMIIGGLVAIFALIALVLIADAGLHSEVIEVAGLASDTPTTTQTSTPTFTPTATFTPTHTPLPTATPLEGQAAAQDEVLLVIADFERDTEGVADQLAEAVEDETDFRVIRVEHTLQAATREEERAKAQAISEQYNATLVMWGSVSDGGVRYYFETTPRRSQVDSRIDELAVSVAEIENFEAFVFEGMDAVYILEFTVGQLFYFEQDYEMALTHFQKAEARITAGREQELKAENLYVYLGYIAHVFWKDYEQSILYYDKTIELDPQFTFAYHNRAVSYYQLEQYQQAIIDYDKAIELNPKDQDVYYNRGLTYAALGEYGRAIEDYNKAIELNPDYTFAFIGRGIAYSNLGEYGRAIEDYNKAIELDPDYVVVYQNRGVVYATLGEYGRAIEDYNKAIELNQNYIFAFINRGVAYRHLGEYEQAIADYDKALELDPEYVAVYYNRGVAYHYLREYEQAIENYNKVIEITPEFSSAFWGRGDMYYELKDYEKSLADYRQYESLTGQLEPFMVERIAEMEAALVAENQ